MTTKSEGGVGEADRLCPECKGKQKAMKGPGVTLLKNHVLGLRMLVLEHLPLCAKLWVLFLLLLKKQKQKYVPILTLVLQGEQNRIWRQTDIIKEPQMPPL